MEVLPINVNKWIQENRAFFLPPVCNKLMHNDQLKVMFVGGPNQRKDYHIEEGEELFYQVKGDMCLKIIENGEHKDIHIKEGEMFLLPARIPHSPQRLPHTVGLVFERRRLTTEKDGLSLVQTVLMTGLVDAREQITLGYYIDNSTEVLFEKWFYCEDLGTQLGPIINEFFNSEQYKTGKPDPDQISKKLPFSLNTEKVLEPFSFHKWIEEHRLEIDQKKQVSLFKDLHETQAAVYGSGQSENSTSDTDTWLWQLEGSSCVTVGDKEVNLAAGDSLLIPQHSQFSWHREDGCIAFSIRQDPARRKGYN